MTKLTEAQFARRAFHIAARASSWASECIMFEDWLNKPMREEAVARFTDEMRGLLDRIDQQAGRQALEAREGRE